MFVLTTRLIHMIDASYTKSNRVLLDLLLDEHHLLDRLRYLVTFMIRSMKTFFLLDQSDYLTHFLDVALDHLSKPASEVSLQKLNSLLELVVRTPSTVASSDPYKEDLEVELSPLSLFDQLTSINSMVGIDMKKHLQNMRAGKSFEVSNSLATPEPNNYAGIKAGKLTGKKN